MMRRPLGSTRTDTRLPYTTLFRSGLGIAGDSLLPASGLVNGGGCRPKLAISFAPQEQLVQTLGRFAFPTSCGLTLCKGYRFAKRGLGYLQINPLRQFDFASQPEQLRRIVVLSNLV